MAMTSFEKRGGWRGKMEICFRPGFFQQEKKKTEQNVAQRPVSSSVFFKAVAVW
jgi:hypothetical protein